MKTVKKKRGVVNIDVDLITCEISFPDMNTFNLNGHSHYCPRVSIGIPMAFQRRFGYNVAVAWRDNLVRMVSRGTKTGYKGTPYEDVVKNGKTKNSSYYRVLQKDMAKLASKKISPKL